MNLRKRFQDPPRQYSLAPFWFLNDDLNDDELRRQMDDFEHHGVYAFVPHGRIGLPDSLGYMSEQWLHYFKVCAEHAAAKHMEIILYDEGMYPSGSCAGQVAAANPRHAARCIERRQIHTVGDGEELIFTEGLYAYVHCPSNGTIRGIHFGEDDGEPNAPRAGDILNPEAVQSFLHLTHDRYYDALKDYYGTTIVAIFTDEPNVLGRHQRPNAKPWTWDFAPFLKDFLGYDFVPHLPALWDDAPETRQYRDDFDRAVNARLEQAYYAPYGQWCAEHGIALTGHPAGPMDIGVMKHFQWPGQDIVWRYIEPFADKSLEGDQSTMAKCSASVAAHRGRARNLNECFGAYGWEFTYEEMRWITNWLLVRGVSLLTPHAFYYSLRGPRRDERPPDVGPNSPWWDRYKPYADFCRRLCWLNAESTPVCDVALLGTPTRLPWRSARALFEHQRDFMYLDTDTLRDIARVTRDYIEVGPMKYRALVIEGAQHDTPEALEILRPFIEVGRVIAYLDAVPGVATKLDTPDTLTEHLATLSPADLLVDPPTPHLRYRHVRLESDHFYLLANEGREPVNAKIRTGIPGNAEWWDCETGKITPAPQESPLQVSLPPYTARLIRIGI